MQNRCKSRQRISSFQRHKWSKSTYTFLRFWITAGTSSRSEIPNSCLNVVSKGLKSSFCWASIGLHIRNNSRAFTKRSRSIYSLIKNLMSLLTSSISREPRDTTPRMLHQRTPRGLKTSQLRGASCPKTTD